MMMLAAAKVVGLLLVTSQVGAFASVSHLQGVAIHKPSDYHQSSIPRYNHPVFLRQQQQSTTKATTSLALAAGFPRGGAAAATSSILDKLAQCTSNPSGLFNTSLLTLALVTAILKISQRDSSSSSQAAATTKPASIVSLQRRFLAVFWLLRCADWLQGPYFYEVYASKIVNGAPASMSLVSNLFLTGFASTALFGPLVGRATDQGGRKKGTLAFAVLYAAGALTTKSPLLKVLFVGRILSGIGTSLLFSAPESWLVGEAQKSGDDPDGKYLGETFGLVRVGQTCVLLFCVYIECFCWLWINGTYQSYVPFDPKPQ